MKSLDTRERNYYYRAEQIEYNVLPICIITTTLRFAIKCFEFW